MRALLAATAVAASLLVAAPAQAHPTYHYEGGCFLVATNAPGGDHGDSTTWQGVAGLVVVATDAAGVPSPTTWISAECHVYRDGVYQSTWLSASGVGAAATLSETVFQSHPNSVVTICQVVTVGGEVHTGCGDATTTPIVPEPVQEVVEISYEAAEAIVCVMLRQLPSLPPFVVITPEGDTYVLGEFFWDCPPYTDDDSSSGMFTSDWYLMTSFGW